MTLVMKHPEAQKIIGQMFDTVNSESDRGIVLIGLSIIDHQLKLLFESLTPDSVSSKRKKALFDSRGAFGELSSKLDIAEVCRLLPTDLVQSIHKLRKLRNTLAHEISTFSLSEHYQDVLSAFELLDNMPPNYLLDLGLEITMRDFISSVSELKLSESDQPMFSSIEDICDYITQNRDISDKLEHRRLKMMFAVGVSIHCSLIIFHRNNTIKAVKANKLTGSLSASNP
jgi:hypothetical protein